MSELQAEIEKRKRLGTAGPVDEVLLTYARWLNGANDPSVDQQAEKQTLDNLIDGIEADGWGDLKELVGLVDDRLLKDVMVYSGKRAQEQLELSNKKILEDLASAFPPPRQPSKKKKRRLKL